LPLGGLGKALGLALCWGRCGVIVADLGRAGVGGGPVRPCRTGFRLRAIALGARHRRAVAFAHRCEVWSPWLTTSAWLAGRSGRLAAARALAATFMRRPSKAAVFTDFSPIALPAALVHQSAGFANPIPALVRRVRFQAAPMRYRDNSGRGGLDAAGARRRLPSGGGERR